MKTIYLSEGNTPYSFNLELTKYTDGDIVVSVVDDDKNEISEKAYVILSKSKQRELINVLQNLLEETK